jgi:prepilin-type N-terminal cleavage/methylation domain-containing protein/prepilin-type processing-associated H-X9-DG protein
MKKDLRFYKTAPGFTLMELLVVIAIIAMLLAILMPTLSKIKQLAKLTICGSNLRQIAIGLNTHASEHDNKYLEREVGFPRLAARKIGGKVPQPDLRGLIVNYISSDAEGLLHCPAVRANKAETEPGILFDAVYRSHITAEDESRWANYFTIASFDPDSGMSYGGEPAYMMTYNIFAGLKDDGSYGGGIGYDWTYSGNTLNNSCPKYQGSARDVIASDMQERWSASADTLSRSNHSKYWERGDSPEDRIDFVSSNTAFADGHVELRKELKNYVLRNSSSRVSRFDY